MPHSVSSHSTVLTALSVSKGRNDWNFQRGLFLLAILIGHLIQPAKNLRLVFLGLNKYLLRQFFCPLIETFHPSPSSRIEFADIV